MDLTHDSSDDHVEGIMDIIQNPNPTKNHIGCSQASLSNLRVEVLPPQRKETRLPSPPTLFQLSMQIVLEETMDTTPTQNYCCLQHLKS